MVEVPPACIRLDEEVEGDRDGTSDYVFLNIGSSVPLKQPDSSFDLSNPPARPLAVSDKFGLLFVAHTEGFLVAKTADVVRLAKDIKEIKEGNGDKTEIGNMCVREKSILDSRIGNVHILAISTDSSMLAAAIGGEVRFFPVASLMKRDQEPIFTCSVGKAGHIKDFLWQKSMENSFLVLSTCGLLYHGNLEDHLKDIMDGVEAVDWSVEGNFLAVARNNVLSILSSEFKQQLNMSLLFQSWTSDTDLKLTVKVDSVKWVRSDSIIIGCVQVNESDEEVDYLVQVINTEGIGIPEASSKPVVVTFSVLFRGIVDDIVPFGGGPHLFMSYLESWDLGIVANRKNTDEHVVLLAWSANDERKAPVALEFEQDKFIPRIELQENRDENLLLGMDICRISTHEKLELKIDSELKVLSPYCILLCLSCEGKLIMFHVARISEAVHCCETSLEPPGDIVDARENSSVVLPLVGESTGSTTGVKGEESMCLVSELKHISANAPEIDVDGSFVSKGKIPHRRPNIALRKEMRSLEDVQTFVLKEQPSVPLARNEKTEQTSKILQLPVQTSFKQGVSSVLGNSMKSGSQMYNFTYSGIGASASSTGSILCETSTTSQSSKVSSKSDEAGPVTTHVDSIQIASFGLRPLGRPDASYGHAVKSSLLSSNGSIPGNSRGTVGIQRHISQSFSTTIQPSVKFSKDSGGFTSSSDGSKALIRPGHNEPVPAIHGSLNSFKGNSIPGKSLVSNLEDVSVNRVSRAPEMLDSEPTLSKQFYSVNDMAKELDILLGCIEQEGGFRDACTVIQRSLVLSLEEGLKNLSERFRMCKAKMEEQLKQIQQLQDKRMQVSARQIYMEGLVTQASNGQYWDIWNCQKLGPEFEVKQQRISKLNHGLVNELVELERHFNALELKKYGDSGAPPKGRRALLGSSDSSRQIYSVHSLYNTVDSQLAAAEQLFECLSKQMAILNINSPPSKRQSITKELLESIGFEYDAESFHSPDPKKAGYSLGSSKNNLFLSLPSSSRAVKEHTRRNTLSTVKTFEPESSRRKRDSLDMSWTRFDPPKTTVKRMLQKERFQVSAEKFLSSDKKESIFPTSESSLVSQKHQEALSSSSFQSSMNNFQSRLDKFSKDEQNKLSKQVSEYQTNSIFKWTEDLSQASKDDISRFSATLDMQPSSIQSTPLATSSSSLPRSILNQMQEIGGLADKSRSQELYVARLPDSSVESDSLAKARVNAPFDASAHNQTFLEASSSFTPSKMTPSIKTVQSSVSLTVKSGEDECSFPRLEKSYPSLPSGVSGNVSQVKTITSRSQSCGTLSSTTISTAMLPSLPEQSSGAAPLSFVSVSTSPSELPAASSLRHSGGSSPITVSSLSPSQTSLSSSSSVAPVDPLRSSSGLFQPQISKTSAPLLLPLEDVTSRSLLAASQAPTIDLQSTASKDLEPTEVFSKPQPASLPTSEDSTELRPDKKSSLLSSTVSLASATSHSLSEISSALSNLPSTPNKGKDEGIDITVTEEDDMEEEAPETNTMLNLGALGGFGLGPTSASSAPRTNPFGGSLITSPASSSNAAFSLTTPTGELFRPASFSLPSSQPMQSSQPMNAGGFSGGFSGFGQPAQIGAGQQALGSVLGAFGQSRQLGVGAQGGGFASSGGFGGGGFSAAAVSGGGGFASGAAAGGGFSAVASGSGGFAGVAGGGFAAMASKSGGFAAAASAGGGFGASSGGGFTSGGFGSFATKQGAGGFPQFSSTPTTGAGKPPAEFLMQMRK